MHNIIRSTSTNPNPQLGEATTAPTTTAFNNSRVSTTLLRNVASTIYSLVTKRNIMFALCATAPALAAGRSIGNSQTTGLQTRNTDLDLFPGEINLRFHSSPTDFHSNVQFLDDEWVDSMLSEDPNNLDVQLSEDAKNKVAIHVGQTPRWNFLVPTQPGALTNSATTQSAPLSSSGQNASLNKIETLQDQLVDMQTQCLEDLDQKINSKDWEDTSSTQEKITKTHAVYKKMTQEILKLRNHVAESNKPRLDMAHTLAKGQNDVIQSLIKTNTAYNELKVMDPQNISTGKNSTLSQEKQKLKKLEKKLKKTRQKLNAIRDQQKDLKQRINAERSKTNPSTQDLNTLRDRQSSLRGEKEDLEQKEIQVAEQVTEQKRAYSEVLYNDVYKKRREVRREQADLHNHYRNFMQAFRQYRQEAAAAAAAAA